MKIEKLMDQGFDDRKMKKFLVHDSPYFRVINFNFRAGQELAIHSHEVEGELSILVLEGAGEFLGADGKTVPAQAGDICVCAIAEPHGFRATADARILVTIAPPL